MAWQALLVAASHSRETIINSNCENVKASSDFSTFPELFTKGWQVCHLLNESLEFNCSLQGMAFYQSNPFPVLVFSANGQNQVGLPHQGH